MKKKIAKPHKWLIDLIDFYKNAKENQNEYFKDYIQNDVLKEIEFQELEDSYFG